MTTTKSTFKRIFCVIFCCLVVVFSFAFPSSAVIDPEPITFNFAVPDPSANFDGYIILPKTNDQATLVAWYITPQIAHDEYQVYETDIEVDVHFSSTRVVLNFVSPDPNAKFLVTVFYIHDGISNNIAYLDGQFVEYGNPFDLAVNTSSKFIGTNYFKNITRLTHDEYEEYYMFNSRDIYFIFSDEYTEYKQLEEICNHFMNTISKLNLTNEQLEVLLEKFSELLEIQFSISDSLSDFVYNYWEQFAYSDFPTGINSINSRLDAIIRILNKKGETEQTTVDSSKVDEYIDIEQSLVHNDEAESALNEFDISIDGQAYSFIWDFITNCFNSHPEVFGLVITILTLGIIALILNR